MSRNKTKTKKGKKKLAQGALMDFMNNNSNAIGTGATVGGSLIGGLLPQDSIGGGIAGGALKGAGQLSALGPYGMAAGAVIGGTMGAINAKKVKEQNLAQDANTKNMYEQMYRQNAGMGMKKGGKLLAKSLNLMGGGNLQPISDDAVQVKANDPTKSDSVELDSAYVDHDEVIDKQNRVFSDDIFISKGKSIAKEAKRLEKMKSKTSEPRFKDADDHIETKLNKLFEYQESLKQSNPKGSFKKGGKIVPALYNTPPSNLGKKKLGTGGYDDDPVGSTPLSRIQDNLNVDYSLQDKLGSMQMRPALGIDPANMGANLGMNKGTFGITKPNVNIAAGVAGMKTPFSYGPSRDELWGGKAPKVNQFQPDWNKAGIQAATFGPNLVSQTLQSRLRGPAGPVLESAPSLNRISADDQLNEISRQTRNAQTALTRKVSGSSTAASGMGNLLAKSLGARNQVINNVNNTNAQIGNNEAWLKQGTRARNVAAMNRLKSDQVDFQNAKLQMTSENTANLSGKVLQQGRERREMIKDMQAMDLIKAQFGDSEVLSRLWKTNPALAESLAKSIADAKPKQRKGGKLPISKKKKI